MRLAAKLVFLYLVGLLLIVGLFSYLTIQQDIRLAMSEHQRHAADLARALQPSIEQALREEKEAELQELLARSTRRIEHFRVRWVRFGGTGSHRPAVPVEMIVARSEVTTVSMPDPSGHDNFYTYVPMETGDAESGDVGSIEIAAPDDQASDRLRRSITSSLIALFGVATLSGLVIWLGGVVMVGRPLNQLIDKVHRVGKGDFSHPVQLDSGDELARLGSALNEMCDELTRQRAELESETASRIAAVGQLRHAERLNTLGRMAAGIAHEIGTPLNVVTGRAELIASGQMSDDETRQSARAIQQEAQRITKTVRQLLDFARQSTPSRSRQSLNPLIERTVKLVGPLIAKRHVAVEVQLPDQPLLADIDPGQIQQVLTNLIINAAQSVDSGGRVAVTLSQVSASGKDTPGQGQLYQKISIQDNGSGISEEDRQHIFEPFFTTKDVGEGTGLGLSISHGIIQEHEGWIDVETEPGRGSCFSIHLPSAAQDEVADP